MAQKGDALLRVAIAEIERLGGRIEAITKRRHVQIWWTCCGKKLVNTLPSTPQGQRWNSNIRTQVRRKLREAA